MSMHITVYITDEKVMRSYIQTYIEKYVFFFDFYSGYAVDKGVASTEGYQLADKCVVVKFMTKNIYVICPPQSWVTTSKGSEKRDSVWRASSHDTFVFTYTISCCHMFYNELFVGNIAQCSGLNSSDIINVFEYS